VNIIVKSWRDLRVCAKKFVSLSQIIDSSDMDKDINRLKVVLAEKKRTNKWLAEQLGVAPSTVSKWCTNVCQPSLETLLQIADNLEVKVQDLIKDKQLI
jgi:DNA-binding Xre family transcriptional regulator